MNQNMRQDAAPLGRRQVWRVAIGTSLTSVVVGGFLSMVQAQDATGGGQNVCGTEPAAYVIRSKGDKRFSVDLTLGAPARALDIVSRQDQTRSVSTDDFIENVQLVLPDGTEQPLAYDGGGTWRLPGGDIGDRPHVRYEIRAEHDAHPWRIGKEEIAYNFDGSSYFTGWSVLLADFSRHGCASTITFDMPEGWKVAAPWPRLEDETYQAHSNQVLHKNGFAMGPSMPTFEVRAGASTLTVVYEQAVADIARQATSDADALFRYYERVYGGPAGASYTIFMVSDTGTDGGAFESSFAQRFALPSTSADALVWRHGFAHEVGHLWNGITISPLAHGENEWFKEGFTDYLTLKALRSFGAIDDRLLANKIENILRRYYLVLSSSGPKSLVEAGTNKQDNRMLVYGGGALVAFLLDGEMALQNGPGAFEAMLGDLYRQREGRFSLERLLSVMDKASDGRASALLEDIGRGIMPPDMKARFAAQGVDLGLFAPEELYIVFQGESCSGGDMGCAPSYLQFVP